MMYGRMVRPASSSAERRARREAARVRARTFRSSTITSRANARKSQIEAYASRLQSQGRALQAVANNVRNNLAPEIKDYSDEFRSYLSFVDSIVGAWDLEFGDWRDMGYHLVDRPRKIGSIRTSSIIGTVKDVKDVFDTIDDYASWFYSDLRGEISDVFVQLRNLSTALWGLNGAFMGVFNKSIELYDVAGDYAAAGTRWSGMSASSAAREMCKDYISHSNYRRLRRGRSAGRHAAWNEVCDRWENPDNGDYVYWSRDDDPMSFGDMPYRLRRDKRLVEPGCLPGEVCTTASLTGYKMPTLQSAKDLVTEIRTTLDTPVVDNVFVEARSLLKEVRDVVNEAIAHLKGIRDGAGWAVLPDFVASYAKTVLNRLINNLRTVRSDINDRRDELNEYKTYWRSGPWRGRVNTNLRYARIYADNLEALRRSAIQASCDFIFPKSTRNSRLLQSYWTSQGVSTSCALTRGKPYISWERERTPDLDSGPAGDREFAPGGGAPGVLETLDFGAIQVTEPKRIFGLLPWQALLVGAGAVVLLSGRKQ